MIFIDNYKDNDFMKEKLKKIIKNEDENKFFDLINTYISVYTELKNKIILRDIPRIDLDDIL